MQLRAVGRSGLLVSRVGLGTSNFGARVERTMARAVLAKALDLGVMLFDTADSYGNGCCEELLGDFFGKRRKQVVISTKWGNFDRGGWGPKPAFECRGGSRSYILKSLEQSLRRLKTDYVDLYQLHMPDPQTAIEETLMTLDALVRQGKIRYIGVSNMLAWQIVEAQLVARQLGLEGFVSFQARYSLLARDIEATLFPATNRYGLGLLPYHPLAEGLLTGKYRCDEPAPAGSRLATWSRMRERSVSEFAWRTMDRLARYSSEHGHTLLQLAMSWLAAQPPVSSIITGATRPEQVEQNVAASEWSLSPQELTEIDLLTRQSGSTVESRP